MMRVTTTNIMQQASISQTTDTPIYTIERIGPDPDREGNSIYKICTPPYRYDTYDDSTGEEVLTSSTLGGPEHLSLVLCLSQGQAAILPPPDCSSESEPSTPRDDDFANEMDNGSNTGTDEKGRSGGYEAWSATETECALREWLFQPDSVSSRTVDDSGSVTYTRYAIDFTIQRNTIPTSYIGEGLIKKVEILNNGTVVATYDAQSNPGLLGLMGDLSNYPNKNQFRQTPYILMELNGRNNFDDWETMRHFQLLYSNTENGEATQDDYNMLQLVPQNSDDNPAWQIRISTCGILNAQ